VICPWVLPCWELQRFPCPGGGCRGVSLLPAPGFYLAGGEHSGEAARLGSPAGRCFSSPWSHKPAGRGHLGRWNWQKWWGCLREMLCVFTRPGFPQAAGGFPLPVVSPSAETCQVQSGICAHPSMPLILIY